MSTEESKKVVLELLKIVNKGDLNGMLDLLAEDATWWILGNIPPLTGMKNKQEMLELLNMIGTIFPKGIRLIADHLIAEGDYVGVEAHSYGETAKGKIYQNKYHWKFEVREEKIHAVKEYTDTLYAKEVLLG